MSKKLFRNSSSSLWSGTLKWKIDKDLLQRFKENNLALQCVSFKLSTQEGIINAIRIKFQRAKQFCFEVLIGAKVEDEVEDEGEKGTIK